MTFTKYLNSLRVIEAIKRLSEKKKSVTEISIECGFGTIRNFNRVFKEITGYSPKSLPSKFSISVAIKDSANMDFDPTLSTTIILQ
jgi:transcriptional regulator GlxA family with amidase domain